MLLDKITNVGIFIRKRLFWNQFFWFEIILFRTGPNLGFCDLSTCWSFQNESKYLNFAGQSRMLNLFVLNFTHFTKYFRLRNSCFVGLLWIIFFMSTSRSYLWHEQRHNLQETHKIENCVVRNIARALASYSNYEACNVKVQISSVKKVSIFPKKLLEVMRSLLL